jgi:DNA-binding NarL/FixJ family response regulator
MIIADHQQSRAGVAKVLAVEDDIRIVGQPHSHEQMLNALEHLRAHVLISTNFPPLYAEIRALTTIQSTRILVVAEPTDEAAACCQRVQGVVFRLRMGVQLWKQAATGTRRILYPHTQFIHE